MRLQLDEMLIIEKMEKMVDPDQPEGEWITKYDLVEKVRCKAAIVAHMSHCDRSLSTWKHVSSLGPRLCSSNYQLAA